MVGGPAKCYNTLPCAIPAKPGILLFPGVEQIHIPLVAESFFQGQPWYIGIPKLNIGQDGALRTERSGKRWNAAELMVYRLGKPPSTIRTSTSAVKHRARTQKRITQWKAQSEPAGVDRSHALRATWPVCVLSKRTEAGRRKRNRYRRRWTCGGFFPAKLQSGLTKRRLVERNSGQIDRIHAARKCGRYARGAEPSAGLT